MNEIQEFEALLRELMQAIELVMQSETISDEFQGQIAQTLELLYNRIEELSSQGSSADGLPPGAPEGDLESSPYPSSNINSFKYDPKSGNLLVKFMGKDSADSGPVYGYEKVPPYIYDVFRRGAVGPKTSGQNQYHKWIKGVTPSHGAAMNALIKAGGYPYRRLS